MRLHLGCGARVMEDWINVDLESQRADVHADLRKYWPWDDESASMIFAEHLFEHFNYPSEVRHFLIEAKRVLIVGGSLSLSVPDAGQVLHDYVWGADMSSKWHPEELCVTRMDHVNYVFHQEGEHGYGYDSETLTQRLSEAGFRAMVRAYNPHLDQPSRRDGSIFVVGVK